MKRYSILLLLLLSFIGSTEAQEMSYDRGKIFLGEEKITLNQARAISYSESIEASNTFNKAISSRVIKRMTYGMGGGITSLALLDNPSNPAPQLIMGAGFLSGGYFAHISQSIQTRKGVELYNEALNTKEEREKEGLRILEEERQRIRLLEIQEKNRIDRFYALLTERLSEPLELIEGVYKSIDKGEAYEYDIAILQSLENDDEFIGVVLSSTDPSLKTGNGIFTFSMTAQADLFFVSYQNKAGEIFENKTAQLEGAVLTMGLKSFIKMYPSENEQRKFTEINPLYDWESSGSGVLMNRDGYIVTNNHVVSGANKIRIAFQNDSIDYNAVVVSQNEQSDVAILKIEDSRFSSNINPVNWNTSFNLGQKVFTLGYPISDKMSSNVKVVDGIVSGTNGRSGDPMYFQTTLPVWYGNSGGPCFNSKGEILGLATQILWDRGEKVDNVAYITKTENIFDLGKELIEKGKNDGEDKDLEQLIEQLIPYSVFIKVNY